MAEYQIRLVGGPEKELATLSTTEDEDRCHIDFFYRGHAIEAEADDYFEAFCEIRLQLEKEGLLPFCYGASHNVYPSGMARGMGAGLTAYKLEKGKQASSKDLVEIFTEGPDIIPASIALQKQFYESGLTD
jgi:hypothetical protein